MQVRISVDRHGNGVVRTENDEALGHITAVDICIKAGELPTAKLTFMLPVVDIHAHATISEDHLRALAHAEDVGYSQITRVGIAERAGCSVNLVTVYLGTMADMRRNVVRAAITEGNLRVLAQALAMGDKQALKAPENLRKRAALALSDPQPA